DAARHAMMLGHLLDFEVHDYRRDRMVPIAEKPASELGYCLAMWARAFQSHELDAMMTSYALDTAELLRTVLHGRRSYGRGIRVVGPLDVDDGHEVVRHISERQFKKEITQDIVKWTLVQARVPEGARLPHPQGGAILAPGNDFAFVIERCHLSESPVYEWRDVDFEISASPFAWTEFVFDGHVLMTEIDAGRRRPWLPPSELLPRHFGYIRDYKQGRDLRTRVPGSWITHELIVDGGSDLQTARAVAVPDWNVQ
ncbi:MAG: hypothetical protein KF850_27220, partial [Labilithrix sp.]|nr:hypothetical protein [Labilithrix sp.]